MYNNNCFGGNNCLWIIILLILFCGCGNMGGCSMPTNNGCGNNCGCGGHDCCCYPLDDPGLPNGGPILLGNVTVLYPNASPGEKLSPIGSSEPIGD